MKVKLFSEEIFEVPNVWFTSDTHYWHNNITLGESDWADKSGCRAFDTVKEMSQAVVKGINTYVKAEDLLFHLGDWSFGGSNNIANFRRQLKVNKLIVITGNHDSAIQKNKLLKNCSYGEAKVLGAKENLDYADSDDIGAGDLFYSTYPYLELSIEGQMIILCHYPLVSWNSQYKGSWMLHGHCHGSLFKSENNAHWYKKSKILDVGIDNVFSMTGEYKPLQISEIRTIMNKKSFVKIDHHDQDTD